MYRRRFLQTLNLMGASLILPRSEGYDEGSSIVLPTTTQPLVAPTYAVEDAADGWDVPKVGVVAVGGLGGTILNDLSGRLPYINRAIAITTDVASFQLVKADRKILAGDRKSLPHHPHAPWVLAQSCLPEITDAIAGLDMVFLVAEMDGAAGSDLSPLVAKMLHEQNILTLAFATWPLNFNSQHRRRHAQTGIRKLQDHVNLLLKFPDGNIERVGEENASFKSVTNQATMAFEQLWRGILNPVCRPGLINVDVEDLRHNILSHEGDCAFGFGSASGVNGAEAAIRKAIDHPLLGQNRLQRASAALIAVRSSQQNLLFQESKHVLKSIRNQLSPDAWVIYGAHHDDTLGDEITVSVLASGIRRDYPVSTESRIKSEAAFIKPGMQQCTPP